MKHSKLLEGVHVTPAERVALEAHLANWGLMHAYMTSIKGKPEEEIMLKKMIYLEKEGKGRLDVLGRLKGRLNRVRSKRESRELLT